MTKQAATQAAPQSNLSQADVEAIAGQLKGEFAPLISQIQGVAAGGAAPDSNSVDNLVNTVLQQVEARVGEKVDKEKAASFRETYAYFDQANDMFPLVIGGGRKGTADMLKKEGTRHAFEPISSGIAYARSQQLCHTGRAVNWVAETKGLGDIMYVLAAIGVVGGLVFLGKLAYDAWIA